MVKCNSCKYSSKFTNGLILCDFLKTKICVTANHTCKYGKPEEKMENLINGQPEQDIEHCATCIHAADSEDICILRKCKYAIAELKDCYEPEQRWIPCDKGEPDEDMECWVTGKTTDALYRGNFTKRYGERRDKGFITSGGFMWWNTALAWMPIYEPEPYKGGEDE